MKEIIIKYLEGRASETEQNKLLEWLRNRQNRLQFRAHVSAWKESLDRDEFPGGGGNSWYSLQQDLLRRNYYKWHRSRKLQFAFRYAAIFFFLFSLSGVIWYFTGQQHAQERKKHTNLIAQGGQISRLELPDGTKVWLKTGGTISYNNDFSYANRNITLIGEAYFDVAKNEALPLVVNCNGLEIKALGTKFNAAAYPQDSAINVVLEEGLLALSIPGAESFQYRLRPGELGRFKKETRVLKVNRVNTHNYTAWRKGIISINDQTLEKVAERLEKRYNQEFEVDEEVKTLRYTFTIKSESLDQIISLMERITPVKAIHIEDVIRFEMDKNKKEVTDE